MSPSRPQMRPFELLRMRAVAGASGEFICASPSVEIHVFLQGGRVAWATDSLHPFAFARHLQETAAIDADTFRQTVEECRRERLPLGETLVEWGLASRDAVRGSLVHQIALALGQLAALPDAQTLFLERGFAGYDERLTFSLDEIATPVPVAAAAPARDAGGRARDLRTAIEGLAWVDVMDGDVLVDSDPVAAAPRIPSDLVHATLLDGADFVALRTAATRLVGLGGPRSLWCQLEPGSALGGMLSTLWAAVGSPAQPAEQPPARPDGTWQTGSDPAVNGALAQFHARAPEMLASLVLDGDGALVAGHGCDGLELERCLELARRRMPALVADAFGLDAATAELDSIGFSLRMMISGDAKLWCCGARLEGGVTSWAFLDRRSAQGLGWAYLTAVTRALHRVREGA